MFFIPAYILILFLLILIDYSAAILIENYPGKKKIMLVISLATNIAGLALFKYYNFIAENINQLFEISGREASFPMLHILLPIGLSFHTFQSMAYTIEVYRGNQKAERNLGIYSLYVLFFPQLVAGPIERPANMIPQFYTEKQFDYSRMISGVRRILWGLFKKAVIADRIALFVNPIYNSPTEADAVSLIIATYLFAFQIYCDFSGYCDIAIGSAKILGINLSENFNNPYSARSISDFWRRWHITLSNWFRDYLYIPLGGNRGSMLRQIINLLIVFLISGLWHGANWTYVVWGGLHGLCLVIALLIHYKESTKPFISYLQLFLTFNLVCFTWIFFRANSLTDAFTVIRSFTSVGEDFSYFTTHVWSQQRTIADFLLLSTLVVFMLFFEKRQLLNKIDLNIKWSYAYSIIILLSIIIMGQTNKLDFIYFQF
jgi:alginate O-acetyltransferase complex protein AlgI